jgi:exonuclease SbcC
MFSNKIALNDAKELRKGYNIPCSLDPESLDSAIEALFSLNSSGRLVGIISHVEELKTRIPVHIEIDRTAEGSTAKIIV